MPTYVEGDEIDGEDADVLGRVARQIQGRQGRIYTRPPLPARTAQPTESELRSFLGMGGFTFTAATGLSNAFEVEPQESFRGERLIIDSAYTQGTDPNAVAPLISVARIEVGTQPQSPSVQFSAPAAMFRFDAVGAGLDLQVAYRGTKLIVTVTISRALAGTGTLFVNPGFFGQWIR